MRSQTLSALVTLVFSAAATAADAGPAELRWKFEKDKPIYQETTTLTKSTMKVMGTDLTQSMKMTFFWSWTPREQDAKKNWTIRQRVEAVQLECDIGGLKIEFDSVKDIASINPLSDFFRALVGSEFILMVNPDNKVTRVDGREEFLKRLVTANQPMEPMFRQLLDGDVIKQAAEAVLGVASNRPTKKGDTWSVESKLSMGLIGTFANTLKYTCEGADPKDPGLVLISIAPEIKYAAPPDAKSTPLPFKIKTAELQCRDARGAAVFNAAKGRLASSEISFKIDGKLSVEVGGQASEVEIEQTQKTTTKMSDENPITKR